MAAPSTRRRGAGTRTGSTSGAAVEVQGLAELRRELRRLENPREWTKELGRVQRDVAKKAAGWAQTSAKGMGGPQSHFATAIRGRGGVTGARIVVARPEANAAFWGAKKRTGWYARYRYSQSTGQQHPRWVGASWDVAKAGEGPYAINASLAARMPEIERMYLAGIDALTKRAFPT